MHFGGAMFFTDYSMSAPELARALEERGFESVWARHFGTELGTPKPVVFALMQRQACAGARSRFSGVTGHSRLPLSRVAGSLIARCTSQ
jgi:hypothetical protein